MKGQTTCRNVKPTVYYTHTKIYEAYQNEKNKMWWNCGLKYKH